MINNHKLEYTEEVINLGQTIMIKIRIKERSGKENINSLE